MDYFKKDGNGGFERCEPPKIEYDEGDGKPLISIRHPQRVPFFKRMWRRIFNRPKFTEGAMEEVETLYEARCRVVGQLTNFGFKKTYKDIREIISTDV